MQIHNFLHGAGKNFSVSGSTFPPVWLRWVKTGYQNYVAPKHLKSPSDTHDTCLVLPPLFEIKHSEKMRVKTGYQMYDAPTHPPSPSRM